MRVVMDRFVARLGVALGDQVVLKGGMVLELRMQEARSTKDVDVRLVGKPEETLVRLQQAGRLDLQDHLLYRVVPDPRHPSIDAEGMTYEGLRFKVQCELAGKPFGAPFGLDVAFAEPMAGQPERVEGPGFLAFAGVTPGSILIYPVATHLAEKLHAYTLPRSRPNSRVKDLPDIALLALIGPLEAEGIRKAIDETFGHRGVQPVPTSLPPPSESWVTPYLRMAKRDALRWHELHELYAAVQLFLDPVLQGVEGQWRPEDWKWKERG